ncbi:MAG: glycosyltransferase, partial [Actinobacteria bacterium]|nr:glycosyltransferase [Actinomycetota bacterium]
MTGPPRKPHGELRCLIAAGGTAGHVLPSLAVAEALRERGVQVTFAGSPDRVEARLVPAHGYPFDAFSISGFPRRPSLALLRSLFRAGRAPT